MVLHEGLNKIVIPHWSRVHMHTTSRVLPDGQATQLEPIRTYAFVPPLRHLRSLGPDTSLARVDVETMGSKTFCSRGPAFIQVRGIHDQHCIIYVRAPLSSLRGFVDPGAAHRFHEDAKAHGRKGVPLCYAPCGLEQTGSPLESNFLTLISHFESFLGSLGLLLGLLLCYFRGDPESLFLVTFELLRILQVAGVLGWQPFLNSKNALLKQALKQPYNLGNLNGFFKRVF